MATNTGKADPSLVAKEADNLIRLTDRTFNRRYRSLPPVPKKIQATSIPEMQIGEHQAIALFSDYHFGSLVDPRVSGGIGAYNEEIARRRLAMWRDGVLRFTQMFQALGQLDTLHFMALGDELEGHGTMFPNQPFQMTDTVYWHFLTFVEDLSNVLLTFLNRYDKVIVHKVPGNHGRIAARAKEAQSADNLELLAWRHIETRLKAAAPDRFEFNIAEAFFVVVEIYGFTFFLRHGHGIGGLDKTYTGAFNNKLRMNSILGEVIDYAVKGHLHTAASMENEIGGKVIQNGSFVGPRPYFVESNQPSANIPSQEFFLVRPPSRNYQGGARFFNTIHLATAEELRQFKVWGRRK